MWLDWLVFCDYGLCVCPLMPLATLTVLLGFLLPWTWGISSRLLQPSAVSAPYLGWGVSPHSHPSWPCSGSHTVIQVSAEPRLVVSFHSKVRGTAAMHRTCLQELLMQAAQNIGLERLYRLSELLLVTQICLHRLRKCHGKLFNFKELFFFFNKISFYFILII